MPGRLFGRTDVAARIDADAIARVQGRLGPVQHVITSPALRCVQTASALFKDHEPKQDARLWEQDFGEQDGLPFEDLPDLGVLTARALAAHTPPGGESFAQLCARTAPALMEHGQSACQDGPIALVVHAGVVRAAMALVTDNVPGALAFEVANLSITRLRCGAHGPLSVIEVNRT